MFETGNYGWLVCLAARLRLGAFCSRSVGRAVSRITAAPCNSGAGGAYRTDAGPVTPFSSPGRDIDEVRLRQYIGVMTGNTALLIVDVQNDFTEGGALGCDGGAEVAARITEHARNANYSAIVASRDWHDAEGDNGGHFAFDGAPNFVNSWPVHCVAGTSGAEYHPALDVSLIDVHVKKGMGEPAYSAFEGETEDGRPLVEELSDRGITHLDIVGIATDHCVRASALDAISEGISVRVINDLTAAVSDEGRVKSLAEMADAGAVVVGTIGD